VEYRLMKKILIIGIGAGDPEYITMQAVRALNEVDVFFMMDKGPAKTKLIELRKEICRRYIRGDNHRQKTISRPSMISIATSRRCSSD
jgi:precorrin-6A synthase